MSADPSAEWSVESTGGVADDGDVEFVRTAAELLGPCSALSILVESDIPRARGLGSSAAVAAAAAAAAARAVGRRVDPQVLFDAVAGLEGHSEQAAAAVFGGAVAVAGHKVLQLEMAPQVEVLVAVPDEELSTPRARRVLPKSVNHTAAARNLARTVFLVEGLRRGDRSLLAEAAGDELHEPFRVGLAPVTAELLQSARAAGAWHAALSGSGSAVVAFTGPADAAAVRAAWAGKATILTPGLAAQGVI
ncbi:MAG: hypothetical protein ACE5E8_01840 [Acidimicrobiia bacterium]